MVVNGVGDDADLPQLQSIVLEDSALEGDWQKSRKGRMVKPFNYKNTLVMKGGFVRMESFLDLPALVEFKGKTHHFFCFGSVVLTSGNEWSL